MEGVRDRRVCGIGGCGGGGEGVVWWWWWLLRFLVWAAALVSQNKIPALSRDTRSRLMTKDPWIRVRTRATTDIMAFEFVVHLQRIARLLVAIK